VGRASLLRLAFGVFFFDYDLDGWPDIFAANGHIEEEIGRVQPKVSYAEPPLLFHNLGRGRFEEVGGRLGLDRPMVARGAAYADIDHDGDLDILVSNNQGPACLLRNDANPGGNHWLRVSLEGTQSNRDGIGAVVRVMTGAGRQWQVVHSGSSYCSQSELPLTFGLGREANVQALEVEWPSGRKDRLVRPQADREILVVEGKGMALSATLKK
jgi:hypothetical protein